MLKHMDGMDELFQDSWYDNAEDAEGELHEHI